jgi:hypothetical protein
VNLSTADRTIDVSTSPTKDELNHIREGTHVCLSLNTGARFWAQFKQVRNDSTYQGIAVDTVKPVHKGDLVIFEKQHVFGLV